MFPKWNDWNISYTKKGLFKKRIKTTLKCVVLVGCIVGSYRIRKTGTSLVQVPDVVRQIIRSGFLSFLDIVQRSAGAVQQKV